MEGFRAIEPADYLLDEEPLPETAWAKWINGDVPAIDRGLIQLAYWSFYAATQYFFEGEAEEFPASYRELFRKDDLAARALYANDIQPFVNEILAILPNGCPIQPYGFESLIENSSLLSKDYTRTFAVYYMLCLDYGIAGLLEGIAAQAAKGFGYANVALDISYEYRISQRDKGRATISQMARRGALARLENDPKQREKEFVFVCWQAWHQEPSRYKSKAEFARDMLQKADHLTSQKKIEDWCREWEKENPAS